MPHISPSLHMLHVLTMTASSTWPFGGMFNYVPTAINTLVLEVLCKTELWASPWLSREASPSYWQNPPVRAMPSSTWPHRESSDPCFQQGETQAHEGEGSTESSCRHPRWWRLRTVMDTAQSTCPTILIPPVKRFDQCRFSDRPKGLLFLHFCLSVWHTFPLGWGLPGCTAILFLPFSSQSLYICMGRHKTAHSIFYREK